MKILMLTALLVSVCAPALQAQTLLNTQTSAGVVLHGCQSTTAWIENTSQQPKRIQAVRQSSGEMTVAIFPLQAGEKVFVGEIGHQAGFYIFERNDGYPVGFLRGSCPTKK